MSENMTETIGSVSDTISHFTMYQVLFLVVLILVCLVVKKVLMGLVERAIQRMRVDKSLHTFIKSVFNILLWFIVVLIVAQYIGIPVTSLLAVLSLAGLAISLAIQGTLSNLAGGIQILVAKPFGVGEFVEAGGVSGTVSDIGLVYTQITTVDNKIIYVPNSEIAGAKVTNYTHQECRRVDLTFSASYDCPVVKVEGVLLEMISAHPMALSEPDAPFARVSNYGASSIEYTVRVWCATENYWDLYFDLVKGAKEAFDRHGIEMTYDHLNVHVKQD